VLLPCTLRLAYNMPEQPHPQLACRSNTRQTTHLHLELANTEASAAKHLALTDAQPHLQAVAAKGSYEYVCPSCNGNSMEWSGAVQVAPVLRQRCIATPALRQRSIATQSYAALLLLQETEGSVRSTHPQVGNVCGQASQLAVINEKRLGALHRGSHACQLLIQQAELCGGGGVVQSGQGSRQAGWWSALGTPK
jgi:hypothetical protein